VRILVAFLADLRVAFRTLLRSPGLFALATLVLGLGVASVASMFGALRLTVADPPLERTDRVFSLMTVDRTRNDLERWVPLHDLQEMARQQTSFEAVAGWLWDAVALRREGGVAERCVAARVTGPFFGLLRIQPLLGRNLLAEDARPGAAPVVVISERLWRSAFAADPAIVGQSVRLNGEPVTVVGVAPAVLDIPIGARVWIPDRSDTSLVPRVDGPWFHPLGRLRDGVTPDAARAELRAIQARRAVRYPEIVTEVPDVRPFSTVWLGIEFPRLVRVLFGSVLLVLALACVNVAGLLLVRAAGRTHEAAVRRALGAGRLRLAGQLLAESAIIGVAAVLVAVILEEAGLEMIRRVPALESAPSWWRFRFDLPMAGVIVAAAAAATLGAGLYPAIRTARVSIEPLLREGQRDTGLHAARLVRWLVVAEIALSSALLSAAGLVIRSAATLGRGDVGVPTAGWLQARIDLPRGRYDGPGMARFIEGLGRSLQAIPGARATAITTAPPGIPSHWPEVYQLADRPNRRIEELPSAKMVVVSGGYFETVQIPLVSGRGIGTADVWETQRVAVVSESLARSAWPGGDAVGRQVRIGAPEQDAPWMTVVGVARDVRYDDAPSTLDRMPPIIYMSLAQWPSTSLYALVRGTGDPLALAAGVREAARLEPDLAVHSIRTLDEERRRNTAGLSILGTMFVEFGIVTLLLAAAGVYGVLAYSVAQGAREIAIRRALGAPDRRIVATVMGRAGWQLLLGLTVGLVLVPVMGALVGSVLGQHHHPVTLYLEVAAALSATLLVSVLVPLRRALALDPAVALHHT
jgi:predicted permease